MKPLVLVLILAAAPALADCPTGDDLATGIRIVEDDGPTSIFTQNGENFVEQVGKFSDGYTFRTTLAHGVHVTELVDLENGAPVRSTAFNTDYVSPVAELPVPTAGAHLDFMTRVGFADEAPVSEQQTQIWGQPFEWTIGDCTVTAIPGEISYLTEDGTALEGVYYIPDLGISFQYSFDDDYGSPEVYTAVRIDALR